MLRVNLVRWTALLLALTVLWESSRSAMAVDANSQPFSVKLSSGQKSVLRLRGNEHFRWLEDQRHFPVIKTDTGYEYAVPDPATSKLTASGHKLGSVDPLKLGFQPQLPTKVPAPQQKAHARSPFVARAAENRDLTGNVNVLVVLMRFRDHATRKLPTAAEIEIIMNRPGGDPVLAPSGSFRDFVHENSYRQLDILSHVFGWIDLPETEAYYAGGDSGLSGGRLDEALKYALNHIDQDRKSGLDFATFDRDKDQAVGAVIFLHSGYAAEETIGENLDAIRDQRIWSHKSGMPIWKSQSGHTVNNYYTTSALFGSEGDQPCRIGVLLHEAAHLGALDDHYDNHHAHDKSAGVGSWCLTGEHRGFDGSQRYPSHLSAWCKIQLGWVKPIEIAKSGEYRIHAVERTPEVFKITHGFPAGEYLLIENRQPIGFDQNIPAGVGGRGGLAIWHIDESKEDNSEPGHPGIDGWPEDGRHFKLSLLQADSEYELELPIITDGNGGDGDDLFRRGFVDRLGPGDVGVFPNTDAYQGGVIRQTGIVISDISDSAEEMTFRVLLPGVPELVESDLKPQPQTREPVQPSSASKLSTSNRQQEEDYSTIRSRVQRPVPNASVVDRTQLLADQKRSRTSSQTANTEAKTYRLANVANVDHDLVLMEIPVSLDVPTQVVIRASGVADGATGLTLATGMSDSHEAANKMWPETFRMATLSANEKGTPFGTTFTRRLPAGEHVLQWKVACDDGQPRVLSGARVEMQLHRDDEETLNNSPNPEVRTSAALRTTVAGAKQIHSAPQKVKSGTRLPVVVRLAETSDVEVLYHGTLNSSLTRARLATSGIECRNAEGEVIGPAAPHPLRVSAGSQQFTPVEATRKLRLHPGEYTFSWKLQSPNDVPLSVDGGETLTVIAKHSFR